MDLLCGPIIQTSIYHTTFTSVDGILVEYLKKIIAAWKISFYRV